ncbi:MAG: ribosome small subunit-dependent GTPase A [Clostridia bacterium]|nr:ribosome small subunit-dependent GTPase A [Clostridia bacterium]
MLNDFSNKLTGRIIKGIGGFYYVEAAGSLYECKAKGILRKKRITPLAGDFVVITINDQSENTIDEILERKNSLVRPPLANVDVLAIVVSTCSPVPNFLVIDKLISIAENKGIEPVIIVTKNDIADGQEIARVYINSGFKVFMNDEVDAIKAFLNGKIVAFTGNSGVGKSTLLNKIDSRLGLSTGEISEKLGRGRHTTRHVELYKIGDGYIADTPGFSSVDMERCERVLKADLAYCFREFREFLGECRFTSCAHLNDLGCAITQALSEGKIEQTRYNSYASLYEDAKKIKEWENK